MGRNARAGRAVSSTMELAFKSWRRLLAPSWLFDTSVDPDAPKHLKEFEDARKADAARCNQKYIPLLEYTKENAEKMKAERPRR